ncbi:MAG: endopeptidase [Actinomycetota bacterium]|jgi:STE24 endopeptidase
MTTTAQPPVRTIDPSRSGITPWKAFKANPEDWFDPEEIAKARRYTKPLKTVRAIQIVLNLLIDVAVIRSHVFPKVLRHLALHNWVLDIVVVMIGLLAIGVVENVGFEWWRAMVYDKKWEFSTMTPGTFVGDQVKTLLINGVFSSLMFIVLWAVVRATDAWWILGWAVFSIIQVGLALIAPRFIAPLFNKFTQIPDDDLHADIISVAHGVGADIEKVEMADASKRDVRKNAYVAGAGKTRRMIVFDTMLEWPRPEVRWVCAHEIGHWRRRHIMRIIPVLVGLLLVDFAVLKLIFDSKRVLHFAGVNSIHNPGVLPLFLFVFALPGLVTGLAGAYISRVHERDADLFGLEAVPDPEAAHAAMRKLHTESLSDLTPSLWKRLNHSHPPVAERLAMIAEWQRRNSATAAK